ncbi:MULTISPECIES: lysylphosphatidylglycerol synthase domain-containing protein [unclassified Sphingomonas]|jgi:putative membrane protein|uniref:lysylphosphatidylglycerol synthase domain-containing protein n=1 Tax=unclassified Sphingomonas TaxID=196159 RepID=UPI00082A3784|nr:MULTISPECIES: lysylphosphatidylglycerol synthase domain-containing protein [unclassified Sphingomonas]MCH4894082.1 HpnL family protein [Sphingomonas sp. SFZ2018-12]
MSRANWALLAAVGVTMLGLAVTLALIGAVGARDVLAVLARIGAVPFLVYAAYTLFILSVLGLAWQVLTPGLPVATFVWARTLREAATNLLPFSQFGGIVVGLRVLVAGRVPQPVAYASQVADQTAELAAQLVYTLYGVAALLLVLNGAGGGGDVRRLALVGLAASVAIILAFAFAQRPMLALAARIGGAMLPGSAATLIEVRARLDAIYARRGRLIACFLLHLLAWVASGAGAAIVLDFIGIEISLHAVIVIESLIFTLRTAAFLIPGGVGVQEGAYVLIGPLFGLPPEAALALSLAKRARDLIVDVPALLVWQLGELRSVAARRER